MIQRIYNSRIEERRNKLVIENLQVSKLHIDGTVEVLDLSQMEEQVMRNKKLIHEGKPLEVNLDDGEYLTVVSRFRKTKRVSESYITVNMYGLLEKPVTVFVGTHGRNNVNAWMFPLIEGVSDLYETMFSGNV